MISNTLAAAFVLLSLNFSNVSATAPVVEPITIEAPAAAAHKMTSETERILIEEHAAPNWNLSQQEAWNAYGDGMMIITELTEDEHYLIKYDGGSIEVVLEQGHG